MFMYLYGAHHFQTRSLSFALPATSFEQCQDTSVLGCRSSSPEFNHDGKKGVIISFARVHHQRHTSLVYCCGSKEEESARVLGDPFRHHNRDGRYVWTNEELRDNNIEDGSIILYKSQCFLRNSEKKLVSLVTFLTIHKLPAVGHLNRGQATWQPTVKWPIVKV